MLPTTLVPEHTLKPLHDLTMSEELSMGTEQPSINLTVIDKYVNQCSHVISIFFFNFKNGNAMYAQNLECFTAMICTWDILKAN